MPEPKIKRKDFKLKIAGTIPYWSLELGEIEICLERCLDGFDVGLYKNENLVYPKIKCHHSNRLVAEGLAVEAANRLFKKWMQSSGANVQ